MSIVSLSPILPSISLYSLSWTSGCFDISYKAHIAVSAVVSTEALNISRHVDTLSSVVKFAFLSTTYSWWRSTSSRAPSNWRNNWLSNWFHKAVFIVLWCGKPLSSWDNLTRNLSSPLSNFLVDTSWISPWLIAPNRFLNTVIPAHSNAQRCKCFSRLWTSSVPFSFSFSK